MYLVSGKASECTGCSACKEVCPKNAISMVEIGGFKYPEIDDEKCVNCKLCERICDERKRFVENGLKEPYWGWNKDNSIRLKSTSGGAFPALAHGFLTQYKNASVYGVVYTDSFSVRHMGVTDYKDIDPMCRSKYIQVDSYEYFTDIKDKLEDGKSVMFTGTPCQVAGLKAFLRKDYEKLFTVDIICHGVSNPVLFKHHINDLQNKYHSKVLQFNFREKDREKKKNQLRYVDVMFENGRHIHSIDDLFYISYHAGMFYRESCYNCLFSKENRCSDITLGDYWGIEDFEPKLTKERSSGISLILVNSGKGKQLLTASKEYLVFEEGNYECTLRGQMCKPTKETEAKHPVSFDSDSFRKNVNHCIPSEVFINYYHPKLFQLLQRIKRRINR